MQRVMAVLDKVPGHEEWKVRSVFVCVWDVLGVRLGRVGRQGRVRLTAAKI